MVPALVEFAIVDPMISIDGISSSINYKGQTVKVKVQTTIDYTVSSDVDYFDPGTAIYSDKYFTPDGESDVITVDEILTIDV